MIEIYWITRLDMINGWLVSFSIISGIALLISLIAIPINYGSFLSSSWESNRQSAKAAFKVFKHIKKYSLMVFCVALPLSVLTPTKNEALLIFGVGGTIDYIKNNEVVKQLPDKCVDALDAWVESLNIEKKEETK